MSIAKIKTFDMNSLFNKPFTFDRVARIVLGIAIIAFLAYLRLTSEVMVHTGLYVGGEALHKRAVFFGYKRYPSVSLSYTTFREVFSVQAQA
ncbi:hypothetical protein AGMMS49574_12850 [Bacteroidia bacterium]|nr:hypothetical protein AGMMS49574_12850 [Bacteroidia bacterium]